jgi:hypothetical protein
VLSGPNRAHAQTKRPYPVGLKYRIRPLSCEFVVVSTGDPILVDESAEDRSAVDAVLGEVDGAWWSGFGL